MLSNTTIFDVRQMLTSAIFMSSQLFPGLSILCLHICTLFLFFGEENISSDLSKLWKFLGWWIWKIHEAKLKSQNFFSTFFYVKTVGISMLNTMSSTVFALECCCSGISGFGHQVTSLFLKAFLVIFFALPLT